MKNGGYNFNGKNLLRRLLTFFALPIFTNIKITIILF